MILEVTVTNQAGACGIKFTLGCVVGKSKRDWTRRAGLARRLQMRYGGEPMQDSEACLKGVNR